MGRLESRMLTFLRENKENIVIKVFLGLLALSFVLYFGSDTLRQNGATASIVAEVNGEPISGQQYNYLLGQQIENMQRSYNMTEIPDNMRKMIEQSQLGSLINAKLLDQDVAKLGLQASDNQVAAKIKELFKDEDGNFNRDYYLEQFRPGYKRAAGVSFEQELRRDLARQEIFASLDGVFNPVDQELKQLKMVNHAEKSYTVIKLRKQKGEVKAEGAEAPKGPKTFDKAFADNLLAKVKARKNIDKIIKDNNIIRRDTPALPLRRLKSVLDGDDTIANLKAIHGLEKTGQVVDSVIERDNFYYIVQLKAIEEHDHSEEELELEEQADGYKQAWARALEAAWIESLRETADITES